MLKLRKNLISFILILTLSIIGNSCVSTVFIEPAPEKLPGSIEKIQMETIDFTNIPLLEEKKIIINTYATFIHDIRWRINHFTASLINGNISPDEYNVAVAPLYKDLADFTEKFNEFKASIRDPPEE